MAGDFLNNFSTSGRRLLVFSFLFLVFSAWSLQARAVTVGIAPIHGDSKYPLVMSGLKEVLIADLESTGQFTVVDINASSSQISYENISDLLGARSADAVLFATFREGKPRFTITLRAYDTSTGYNLGSQQIFGSYKNIDTTQGAILRAALNLLRVSLNSSEKAKIFRGHTDSVGAVVALGGAGVAARQKRNVEAISEVSRARSIDRKFRAAGHFMENQAPRLARQVKDPAQAGLAYKFLGKAQESVKEFDRALKRNPKDVEALVGKADVLYQQGKLSQAAALYKQAQDLSPRNADAAVGIARIYERMGKSSAALASYEKARDLGATDPDVYEQMGSIYLKKKDKKRAASSFETAAQLAEKQVHFRKAQKNYETITKFSKANHAVLKQADALLAQGLTDEAITVLRKALLTIGKKEPIFAKLGYAYFLNEQRSQAQQYFRKALSINPSNYEANLYLGVIYLGNPKTKNIAVKHLEVASSLRPSDREAQFYLAEAYIHDQRSAAAVEVLEKLTQARPRDVELLRRLAEAYIGGEDFSKAEIYYLKAIEIQPNNLAAHEGLAQVYLKLGKRKEAMETIEKVYAIDSSQNIFISKGLDLLSGFTADALLLIVNALPRRAEGAGASEPIRHITTSVLKKHFDTFFERARDLLFKIYVVNTKAITNDLEVALYAKYRVIPFQQVSSLRSKNYTPNDLLNAPTVVSTTLAQSGLDGYLGFTAELQSKSGDVAEILINPIFVTAADQSIHRAEGVFPSVVYPANRILTLNREGLLAWAAILLTFLVPFLYITVYQSYKRGKGSLRVFIDYDPTLESFLTLKLSKKKQQEKESNLILVRNREKYEKRKYKKLLKQKGSLVRNMVGKATLFERVPARTYYCYLYGTIEDPGLQKKTIGNYYLEQKVTIEKKRTKEITFQLIKDEAFVTVNVYKGETEVQGAAVRAGDIQDVRYTRPGQGAFVYLKKGKHKIFIQYEDVKITKVIDVHSLDDQIITVDLDEPQEEVDIDEGIAVSGEEDTYQPPPEEGTAFDRNDGIEPSPTNFQENAPPTPVSAAQNPEPETAEDYLSEGNSEEAARKLVKEKEFLQAAQIYLDMGELKKSNYLFGLDHFQKGDLDQAVEYLEKAESYNVLAKIYTQKGDEKKANEARGRDFAAKGQKLEAAQCFVKAECYALAADLYESQNDFTKAAVLYAKEGNFSLAGELFARAGDIRKAAMAFERAQMLDQAMTMYKELGETEKMIELHKKQNHFFGAATLYREQGMIDEAISLCQKVDTHESDYPNTQALLAEMFAEKGMNDLAKRTFEEVRSQYPEALNNDGMYQYGMVLDQLGEFDSALDVFQELQKRDFNYRDVGVRIAELKEKVAQESSAPSNTSTTIDGAQPPKESRYEILGELGRGAMGVVYKAQDKNLDRVVALKTLPHTLKNDKSALESLVREAKTAAKLNHSNIVTVYDVGTENGEYFITMEFVEGKTLQDVLKQVKLVDEKNFLYIARALCDVIHYAHTHKVIHRDVKPSNIILTKNRLVKLMDFGLAKVLQDMAIDKTMLRGTPLYMSPEQVLGKDIDHRTDIYSLGILFYEMLAGRPPFIKGDIMYAHLHEEPPDLEEVAPNAGSKLSKAIMKSISKKKDDRPKTAREFAAMMGIVFES